jgi:riboflavin kinase/FMN adenylyltransferase
MAIFTINWDETPPALCRQGALAIGNLDGVHRGHVALVTELRQRARALGGPAVALTFDPPPLRLLRPDQCQPPLSTIADRADLLQAHGADHVVVLRTTANLLHLRARAFFDEVVRGRFAARGLVEGSNFGFGRDREGDVATLRVLCQDAGLDLVVLPPVRTDDGLPVSSGRIRSALLRGDVGVASNLLGRLYRLRGTVVTGQRRGQSLGFPTANLGEVATLIPRDGVYAVGVALEGAKWPGAANVGPNPTFGEQARKIEVHLIGFHGDLYGRALAVEFIRRLRDTRKFAGAAALAEQLRADIEEARRVTGLWQALGQGSALPCRFL